MKNSNTPLRAVRSWQYKILLLGLLLAMIPVFFVSKSFFGAMAQRRDTGNKTLKKVDFKSGSVREPIEILEMRSNDRIIRFDEAFVEDEWLKGFTIRFKNTSSRTITHLDLNLLFPETDSAGPPMAYSLIYGLYFSKQKPGAPGMKSLAPGEIDEVSLNATSYERLKTFVGRRRDLSELTTANLTLIVVYFDDGIQWSAGELFRPDPSKPGKFIPAKDNQ